MRALVTGATGYVGGSVVRRLLSDGHQVHALVRREEQRSPLAALGARPFTGDLSDPNPIAHAAATCDAVVHCAGLHSPREDRRTLAWVNVAGTENVLQAARHAGCSRIVYMSCADVSLLNCDRVHWKEDRKILGLPLDAHARTKLLAEEVALVQSHAALGVTALRPALLWGPHDPHLLPQLCREASHGGVRLFGDGTNLISTTYIDNLVDAVLLALESDEARGHAFYITDNEFMTAGEFLGQLCQALEAPPPRRGHYWTAYSLAAFRERLRLTGPWRGDVIKRGRSWLFDIQRATNALGYQPRVDLDEGMRRMAAWCREQGGYRKFTGHAGQ